MQILSMGFAVAVTFCSKTEIYMCARNARDEYRLNQEADDVCVLIHVAL